MSEALDATFAALADPARRAALAKLGEGPCRASDLAEAAGLSRPAMSRHLRALRASGLVQERADPSDGRARLYHLHPRPLAAAQDWLADVSAFWNAQLDAFVAAAEGEP